MCLSNVFRFDTVVGKTKPFEHVSMAEILTTVLKREDGDYRACEMREASFTFFDTGADMYTAVDSITKAIQFPGQLSSHTHYYLTTRNLCCIKSCRFTNFYLQEKIMSSNSRIFETHSCLIRVFGTLMLTASCTVKHFSNIFSLYLHKKVQAFLQGL